MVKIANPGSSLSRREFLQYALIAGPVLSGGIGMDQFGGDRRGRRRTTGTVRSVDFRAFPVGRLADLNAEFEEAKKDSRFSRNRIFRTSIAPLGFALPGDFQNARSIIIVATLAKSAVVNFKLDGRDHEITVPFQYYADEWTLEKLRETIARDVIKAPGRRIVDVSKRVPLKLLAARSGLGRYGRNNLVFVEGMGSYNLLHAFLTDWECPDNAGTGLDILDACNHCHGCDRSCPTDCITRSEMVIDAGRCLTLYNEVAGDFPNFILPSMHHTLMGCLMCQRRCPENEWIPDAAVEGGEVSEAETKAILRGKPEPALLESLRRRLGLFPAVGQDVFLPILKRNLGALIRS